MDDGCHCVEPNVGVKVTDDGAYIMTRVLCLICGCDVEPPKYEAVIPRYY